MNIYFLKVNKVFMIFDINESLFDLVNPMFFCIFFLPVIFFFVLLCSNLPIFIIQNTFRGHFRFRRTKAISAIIIVTKTKTANKRLRYLYCFDKQKPLEILLVMSPDQGHFSSRAYCHMMVTFRSGNYQMTIWTPSKGLVSFPDLLNELVPGRFFHLIIYFLQEQVTIYIQNLILHQRVKNIIKSYIILTGEQSDGY